MKRSQNGKIAHGTTFHESLRDNVRVSDEQQGGANEEEEVQH